MRVASSTSSCGWGIVITKDMGWNEIMRKPFRSAGNQREWAILGQ